MDQFSFYAPTRVEFGKGAEKKVGELVKAYGGTKVLLHYGGGSVIKSGLLDTVKCSLKKDGIDYVELGGVVPNPRLSKVNEGVEIVRKENVDFILSVGGGSVLDSGKAIATGAVYDGDVWDLYGGGKKPERALKHGNVITLAATGSEMSNSSVITKDDGLIKKGNNHDFNRPAFTCMNPELLYTLPAYQTACGLTDILMHTFERYFSAPNEGGVSVVSDQLALGVMRTVVQYADTCLKDPTNYEARSEVMWAGSISHNHLTGLGRQGDWVTHRLEHELSAIYDVAHGAGLAAIWASWARFIVESNPERFATYGKEIWGIPFDENNLLQSAYQAIDCTEEFFRSIQMPTSITELIGRKPTEEELLLCAKKYVKNAPNAGSYMKIGEDKGYQIYKNAI